MRLSNWWFGDRGFSCLVEPSLIFSIWVPCSLCPLYRASRREKNHSCFLSYLVKKWSTSLLITLDGQELIVWPHLKARGGGERGFWLASYCLATTLYYGRSSLNLEGRSFQLQVVTNWTHSLRRQDRVGSRTHVDEFAFERRRDKSFIVRGRRRKWGLVFLSPSTYSECQLEEQNKDNRCWNLVVPKFGALTLIQNLAKE